eukprot:jgi/Orpsp1_1/1189602/evm.model.d7180000073187.1
MTDKAGNECAQISNDIGYFKSESTYIVKDKDGNIAPAEVVDECKVATIGKLVDTDDGTQLCLNYNEAAVTVPFEADGTSVNYLLAKGSNIFDSSTTQELVIKQGVNSLLLDGSEIDDAYWNYSTGAVIDGSTNFCEGTILNKHYACNNGVCDESNTQLADATTYLVTVGDKSKIYLSAVASQKITFTKQEDSGIFGFSTVPVDVNHYVKVTDYVNLNLDTTVLWECQLGECTAVTGHIKYGTSNGKIAKHNGVKYVEMTSEENTAITCNSGDLSDSGNVKLSGSQVLQICRNKAFEDVTIGATYLLNDGTNYKKYIVSSDGQLIAESDIATNDYYLVDANDKLASAGSLYKCTVGGSTTCDDVTSTANPGYYLNAAGTKSLITCTGTQGALTCTSGASTVGYYKNGDSAVSTYIECAPNANCAAVDDVALASNSCSEDTIGQLTTGGELCLDGSATASFEGGEATVKYLVQYHRNGLFKDTISSSDKYGVVAINKNSMVIDDSVTNAVTICFTRANKVVVLSSDTTNYESCVANTSTTTTVFATCDNEHVCYATAPKCNVSTGSN